MADGKPANQIAKWNGSTGSWSALGLGMNDVVFALAFRGGELYAGGAFTTAGGNPGVNHIAKWTGSNWETLDFGIEGAVYALAGSGNYLYAGGNFTTASGTPASFVAQWNGSTWE